MAQTLTRYTTTKYFLFFSIYIHQFFKIINRYDHKVYMHSCAHMSYFYGMNIKFITL